MRSSQAASASVQRTASEAGVPERSDEERRVTKHDSSSSTPSAAKGAANGGDRRAGRQLGVDPVDGRLVRLAAGPHGEGRRRPQERPALEVGGRGGQRVRQGGASLREPRRQLGVGRPRAHDLVQLDVPQLGARPGDVARGPAVHAAHVPHQVAHDPLGARRHRGVGARGGHGGGHARALGAQRLDVRRRPPWRTPASSP